MDKTNIPALTMCGYIAAPEINGDSSLISRPEVAADAVAAEGRNLAN
ncbi:hypothetical protein [Ruminococcus albus]|nr:hypothetical protein [Ruminococcus albus]